MQKGNEMSEEDTLYHYCSNDVFCSIIEKSTIWLSALTHSNDWMEGRLISELFAEVVREDNELASKAEYLQAIQSALLDYSPGFGFCLSKRGDVLSQWRGYADDGNGLSIGFNPIRLNGNPKTILIPPALEEVVYKREKQMELLRSLYAQIKNHIADFNDVEDTELDTKEIGNVDDFIRDINKAKLHRCLLQIHENTTFLIKSGGFSEEQEVRMFSMCDNASDHVRYRSVGDRCVPYILYELPRSHKTINKIVLGPKNKTPVEVVRNMLKKHGFGNVEVAPSSIPYR